MELLIQLLSVLIVLRTLLALSLFFHTWQRMLFAGVCACWVWCIYPFAIEQSNRFLQVFFADKIDYLNGGALLMLEGIALLAIRSLQLKDYFNGLTGWWLKYERLICYLLFLPGMCFFAVLYYAEVQLFLQVDQLPFEQLTFAYALLIWAVASWLPAWLSRLLPERDLRIELDCFLLILQLLLAMVFTTLPSVKGFNHTSDKVAEPSAMALLSWLALLLVGTGLGYIQYGRKIKKKNKNLIK